LCSTAQSSKAATPAARGRLVQGESRSVLSVLGIAPEIDDGPALHEFFDEEVVVTYE